MIKYSFIRKMPVRLLGLVLIGCCLSVQPVMAEKSRVEAERQKTRDFQSGLKRGGSFTSDGRHYEILSEVRAVRRGHAESPADTLARAGSGQSTVLEQKHDYVIHRPAATVSNPRAVTAGGQATVLPVALNPDTGNYAILTGQIKVGLRDAADARVLAQSLGLKLLRAFAHLGVAFLEAPPGVDILAVEARLKADARVSSVQIEVQEHLLVPH